MAGICCGVVGESEPSVTVEPSSRASRRRRLELRPFKFVADAAVEGGCKRPKLDVTSQLTLQSESSNGDEVIGKKQNGVVYENGTVQLQRVKTESVQEPPKFGFTSVCGRRRDMEDAVSIRTSFCKLNQKIPPDTDFYGVFDGHGCSHVAMKCKDRLHEIVQAELVNNCKDESVDDIDWKQTMERSFDKMDKEVQNWTENSEVPACRCELQTPQCDAVGSTAVVAVVTPDKVIVSNCGDSRAVLSRNGVAVPLSSDHKPDRPDELERIETAGGRVIFWDGPRVLGVLAMSRAIGDNYLKPYVISEPEVTVFDRTGDEECLILASDGLWDVVSNETACSVVRTCFRSQQTSRSPAPPLAAGCGSSDKACRDASILLTKLALARHTSDNVSVVVVDLRRNQNRKL